MKTEENRVEGHKVNQFSVRGDLLVDKIYQKQNPHEWE